MGRTIAVLALLLLTGCKSEWVLEQREKCRVQGGQGIFIRSEDVFECWGWAEAPSLRFKLNKDLDYKPNKRVKLFETRYDAR